MLLQKQTNKQTNRYPSMDFIIQDEIVMYLIGIAYLEFERQTLLDLSFTARNPFSPSNFATLADFGQKRIKRKQHLEYIFICLTSSSIN